MGLGLNSTGLTILPEISHYILSSEVEQGQAEAQNKSFLDYENRGQNFGKAAGQRVKMGNQPQLMKTLTHTGIVYPPCFMV